MRPRPRAAPHRAAALVVALGLWLSGCTMAPPGAAPDMALGPVSVAALPGFPGARLATGFAAFQESCAEILTLPADQTLGGTGLARSEGGTAAQWQSVCDAARTVPASDQALVQRFLEAHFVAYRITANGDSSMSFAGYFEPIVNGSLVETRHFNTPLYGRPRDLVQADLGDFRPDLAGRLIAGRVSNGRLVPYFTRGEIAAGALSGKHLEIAWVAGPVDAFLLQIEGAGRIRLPNGEIVRLGYDGENGARYVPLGRILALRGAIPKTGITLAAVVAWLKAHPSDAQAVMDENPSYVFFRTLHGIPPDLGPPGALGVPLAPGRALAVSRRYIPLGAPVWIATTGSAPGRASQGLMVAEDIGGDIATPLRADIFFGAGPDAGQEAGAPERNGEAWLLLPRAPLVSASRRASRPIRPSAGDPTSHR